MRVVLCAKVNQQNFRIGRMIVKMAACFGSGLHQPPPIGRPIDRVFEDARFTGEIWLNGRKIREYPKICAKYDLSDTSYVGE